MREAQTLEIDGFTYTVSQLPPTRAVKLFHRLASAASPALGKIMEAVAGAGGGVESMDVGVLGAAFEPMVKSLSPEQLIEVIKELMQAVAVMGEEVEGSDLSKQAVFDAHFKGRLSHLYRVLYFALKVNYGDFLGELLAFAKVRGLTKASPASLSPQN